MPKPMALLKTTLLTACLAVLTAHAEPARDLTRERDNQRLVLDFYERFFNQHNTVEAASVVAESYKQHNPTVPDGKAPFVNFFTQFYKTHPDAHSSIVRSAAEGDLVYMHLHSRPDSVSRGSAILNVFRVENGLITEHWDIIQPVPTESASGNDIFGPAEPASTQPRDLAQEAANRKVVLDFYDGVFNQHKVAESSRVVANDYIQHNPMLENGKTPFVDFFTSHFKDHPESSVQIVRSVAQGDLVWLHVHSKESARDRGQAVLDVFRVRGGQIVEHWDVIQDVPEKSANDNGMF